MNESKRSRYEQLIRLSKDKSTTEGERTAAASAASRLLEKHPELKEAPPPLRAPQEFIDWNSQVKSAIDELVRQAMERERMERAARSARRTKPRPTPSVRPPFEDPPYSKGPAQKAYPASGPESFGSSVTESGPCQPPQDPKREMPFEDYLFISEKDVRESIQAHDLECDRKESLGMADYSDPK